MKLGKVPDQIIRLAMVFAVLLGGLLFARSRFVPKTFGQLGHYRAAAVPAIASQSIQYAGMAACVECHSDVGVVKAASFHRGLSCEVCHGPAHAHAEDPSSVKPKIPRGRDACLYCHEYLASRPTGFPQIIEQQHNPMKPCITCHRPHDPTPPQTPGACAACHASIARTKSLSSHAALECTVCHTAAPEHMLSPRSHLPSKPATREFCGRCHAQEATGGSAEAPRIDMGTHGGGRYLCWQCHYPHDPKGK